MIAVSGESDRGDQPRGPGGGGKGKTTSNSPSNSVASRPRGAIDLRFPSLGRIPRAEALGYFQIAPPGLLPSNRPRQVESPERREVHAYRREVS